jgi:hypothetical protein
MNVLQELYDSEINVTVSSFWDGGFQVKLGDPMNGYVAETRVGSWTEAEQWLRETAAEIYPDSIFASGRRSSQADALAALQRLKDQLRG